MEKEDCKRARSENWVEKDKMLLKELIKERVSILENKNTDLNTNHSKRNAWMDVADSFNSLCTGSRRTITQLKNQWISTKIAAKKQVSERRKLIKKTGGGSVPAEEPVSSEDIMAWLPNEFVVDVNEFDSDSVTQQVSESMTADNCQSKIDPKKTTKENVAEDEMEKDNENLINVTPVIRKKTPAKTQTEHHMKNMVEFEIKCKDELHKRQLLVEEAKLEVQKRKLRNLDLEYEFTQEKMKHYKQNFGEM